MASPSLALPFLHSGENVSQRSSTLGDICTDVRITCLFRICRDVQPQSFDASHDVAGGQRNAPASNQLRSFRIVCNIHTLSHTPSLYIVQPYVFLCSTIFQPPSGQTCDDWAGQFATENRGRIDNPSDTSNCRFCEYTVGDQCMQSSLHHPSIAPEIKV